MDLQRLARSTGSWAVLALGIAAVVLAAMRAEQQLAAINFNAFDDWRTYANAVERWRVGEPIYAAVQVAGAYELRDTLLIGFTYPPAAVPIFIPFAAGTVGLIGWIAVNLGAFILGVTAVLRRELGEAGPMALGVTLIAAAAFPPFSNAVVSGNVNLGIAGLFAGMWVIRADRLTAGLAGIGAVLKIFPGLMGAWSVRRRGWLGVGVAAGTTLAISLITLPLVGIQAWTDFANAVRNAQPECSLQSVSIACSLDGLVGQGAARFVGIAVSLFLAWMVIRLKSAFVAYAALGGALLAPVVDMHPHYWLFAWVVAFVGVVRVIGRRSRRAAERASA